MFHVENDAVVGEVFEVEFLELVEEKADVHADHQRGHREPQVTRQQHVQVVQQIDAQKHAAHAQIVVMQPP